MGNNKHAVAQTFHGPKGLVEAAQFTGDTALAVIEWAEIPSSRCFPAGENLATGEQENGFVVITTPRGDERVELGHWIIRDNAGQFDQMTAQDFNQAGFRPTENL
ncbi:hypothetical protein BKG82_27005 [Mycobacteroides chelonae]|uniref:Uncharacterized protein n=1 Tax=Mycobacteroides chelonae TaxID=1774 RepID=A0A1S1LCC4_MYCCH|nr:hypothetical protein [Mycobacteroides chelonae]OHU47303.1 hypothetical protein BKG82_27005 [Mycobacteroides chelonae]